MQTTKVEVDAVLLLQKHGILDVQPLEKVPDLSMEELKNIVSRQVLYLLERDMERLMQAMYRIDVPEQLFKAALVSENPAAQLAELVLQRELLKVQTRRWYASKQQEENNLPAASSAAS